MALIQWTPKYSVGVERLDDDHQRLFTLLNLLHDGMRSGKSKAILHIALLELINYAEQHFAAEEAAMAFHHYPRIAAHRSEHDKLRAEVQSFWTKYEAGELTLNVEILTFMLLWLSQHILKTDRDYSHFFNPLDVENALEGWGSSATTNTSLPKNTSYVAIDLRSLYS